jgi:hypothetical protein
VKAPRLTPETIEPDRVYDAAAVAGMFGVKTTCLTRWIKLGKLKAMPSLSTHKKFLGADLLAALSAVGIGVVGRAAPQTGDADLLELNAIR